MLPKLPVIPHFFLWLLGFAMVVALVCACLVLGVFEQTAEERLAAATVTGNAETGHYPYCSDDSVMNPGSCYDLRRLDPDYFSQEEWLQETNDISFGGRVLHLAKLVSPDGRDAFFNNVTIAPDGGPIAVGGPPLLIARANDEAQTWSVQKFSRFGDALRDIAFHGEHLGLAVGNNGIIMRSQNRGLTWHAYNETYNSEDAPVLQSRIDGEAYAVAFANDDIAIFGGNEHMVRTTDAGQHWRAVPPDFEQQAIQELAFTGPENGWAIGTGGMVFRTKDGGATWDAVQLARPDTMLMGLDFVGEHGCMAGSWQVWCTLDGGENWTKSDVRLPSGAKENSGYDITQLRMEDAQQGWFTTREGHIYHTQDGGQTWRLWIDVSETELVHEAEI